MTYGFMLGHPVIKLYNTSGLASANPKTKEEMGLDEFSNTASSLPLHLIQGQNGIIQFL